MSDYKTYVLSDSKYKEIDTGNFKSFNEAIEKISNRVDSGDGVYYIYEVETGVQRKILVFEKQIWRRYETDFKETMEV